MMNWMSDIRAGAWRYAIVLLLVIACVVGAFAVTARAGGWAVVTLDDVPETVRAGETVQIGFITRAHGMTEVHWDGFDIVAVHPESGERLHFASRRQDAVGHYVVDVAFPSPGEWQWSIVMQGHALVHLQPMQVLPAGAVGPAAPPVTANGGGLPFGTPAGWRWLGALAAVAVLALLAVWRSRGRLPRAALGAGAALAVLLAAGSLLQPALLPAAGADQGQAVQEIDLAKRGQALFLAKGCATCHVHSEASAPFTTGVGPNLSAYQATPEFLRMWLADPASVKPNTLMPSLGLSDPEIEALIAFLGE